jgi:hypothetical protein
MACFAHDAHVSSSLHSPKRAVVFPKICVQVCIKLVSECDHVDIWSQNAQPLTTDYASSSDSLHVSAGTSLGIALMNYISRSRG